MTPHELVGHDFIRTVSKQHVDGFNPDPKTIRITDIAWVLAGQCRFNNHLEKHYSNAEHSVLMARYAGPLKLKRECTVHDFAEFVFSDLGSPIKQHCPDYKRHISKFERFLNMHFLGYGELSPELKIMDAQITETERRALMDWKTTETPLPIEVYCWDKLTAYNELLITFDKLFPEYHDAE